MEPSLPVSHPSLSYWHRTTRAYPHLDRNRQTDVPPSSKYVIIGSGISGALVAWNLIKDGVKGDEILILEAREAVSGASGRNAGHIRPDAFRGFPVYAAIHGPEEARKIIENERIVLEQAKSFITSNHIDCDFQDTTTIDVCLSQEFVNHQEKSLAAYKQVGGDTSHIKFHDAEDAKVKTRVPDVICAYEWPAGSVHPAKLTQWVLDDVINQGAQLWTYCAATAVKPHVDPGSSGLRWDIHTPRGVLAAETVIHCANAYSAYLLPHLAHFVTPRRSQVHAFVPNASGAGSNVLGLTMSLRYGLHHYFSVNQVKGSGTVILGGSSTRSDADSNANLVASMTTFDDSNHCLKYEENSKKEFSMLFPDGQHGQSRPGEGFDQSWTGILGMTPDNVPLVGSVEGLEGQWICAGFNGHGMARVFTCAPGLAMLISGQPWSATGLPLCFQYTQQRIDRYAKTRFQVAT
ncbi:hypothetical protein PFICI_12261 [Pestalotiopsis fici W106-1]|uniref:FAD dependent oxidoreductase domain-containing protein n=1 Tax=Pestalotiopsis fici (strain W106-1 / CGMCC3.15140) TaxID=1229662 RepID=W3WQA7_PESFW|nr:uncharacterized protein PFICI_12261 [Pestalotiopsis fici W106-1]ETS75317.1 hypothetical protein PFICI_12261 [Pestalotiopsis fici W106-1]